MSDVFTPKFKETLLKAEEIAKEKGPDEAQVFFYKSMVDLGQEERLDNLYRCKDKQTKKKVWFRRNDSQRLYCQRQTRRDAILKSRQIGFTELTIKIGVDNCIFKPGSTEGLMAHKQQKAVNELFQRVRDTFEWFNEDWGELIPVILNKDAANKVIVESVCGIPMKTSYEVSHDFRGGALTRLHRSETSRIPPDRLQGSADAVPERGQIIDETTPRGRGGTFYANWQETKRSRSRGETYVWEPHFFPWFDHYPEPGHNFVVPSNLDLNEEERRLKSLGTSDVALMWRRWKIKENFLEDPSLFDEEYPSDDETCFLGGRSIVPRKYLQLLDKWKRKPTKVGHLITKDRWMEFIEDDRGYLSIWEMPAVGEQYVIGADPSEGVGKDRSAAYVKRRSTGEYVARIWGQLYPEEFAEALDLLGRFYNRAYICFEINNHGHVVKDRLVNIKQYTNLYHRRETEEITGDWKSEIGFRTTRAEKDRIAHNFVARLREGKLRPMDDDLITELTTFQRDENQRLGAVEGCHDDLAMAALFTEEMDVALGPLELQAPEEDEKCRIDEITGYPIY